MSQTDIVDKLLELYENQPQTVFVRYFPGGGPGGKDAVGFALAQGGTYHLRGIHWNNRKPSERSPEYDNLSGAKILRFELEAPITGIACDLDYSPKVESTPNPHMVMCIPSGNFKAVYHFVVSVPDPKNGGGFKTIDPQIVVTPITQLGT